MAFMLGTRAPHTTLLLGLLASPDSSRKLAADQWDSVVRAAREARLLGTLGARLDVAGLLTTLPREVAAHFESERRATRYRCQLIRSELVTLERTPAGFDGPVVLLKGAAYIMLGIAGAEARLVSDVDILVPRARLGTIEATLAELGWTSEKLDAYDQRYYRDWSHELPPLRYPGQTLELDVHHDILPPTGRVHPDAQALFDASVPVPGTRFRALGPEDQLVHAAVHLFQDSDLNGRLRDLVDIDMLVRAHGTVAGFWMRLTERGTRHQATRALWYALGGAHSLLRTSIPGEALDALEAAAPGGAARTLMQRLVPLALLPNDPDRLPTLKERAARGALFARYHWLRMPPGLLARHALAKAMRSLRERKPMAVDA